MTTTASTTRHPGENHDRDRELERTIRDALVLAAGKKAARQAPRHARNRAHGSWQRRLGHAAGHLAGYGTLLACIWYRRRTQEQPAR
jgi:hypothetical protein